MSSRLDTNVLVRYLPEHDFGQADLVCAFLEDDLTPDVPGLVYPVALFGLA